MQGLKTIHSSGYAHRDIKLQNLLIDHEFALKIIDFGFATSTDQKATRKVGTP